MARAICGCRGKPPLSDWDWPAAEREFRKTFDLKIAAIHAGLGDKDAAFEMLQKAYDERSDRMPYLKVEPRFGKLRTDPRFTKLLARLGLE